MTQVTIPSGRKLRIAAFLAVMGPGVIAGLSDDDPAGITTYSQLGAQFGYRLLWVLVVSTIALIVFQDPVSYTHLTLPTNREV